MNQPHATPAEIEHRTELLRAARLAKLARTGSDDLTLAEMDAILPTEPIARRPGWGRPPKLNSFQRARLRRLRAAGTSIQAIAAELRVNETTVYRYLRDCS